MSRGWRTHASKYFSTKDREHVGLGWYDKSDLEHLDYTYISVRTEEEEPKDKGKAKALSQTASVDYHSPREPEAVIGESSEEKEESPQGPVPQVPTPMPGTWAENLEERALAPQLGEIVQIDPGDFGQPGLEYGQKPNMTNIEARVLLGNDPGDKCAIEPSALGTTFGINKAFVPSFGQLSLLKATARIATTMTTPMNPAFVATQHKTGAAKPFPSGSGGGGSGGIGGPGGPAGGPSGPGGGPGGPGGGPGGPGSGPGDPGGGGPGAGVNLGGNPGGGGANGGLKGNIPTVFNGDRPKSDQFLWEFHILMLSNCGHHAMATPLDRIGVTLSYIRGKKVDDWVELTLNKVNHTLQQGVLPMHEALLEMFLRDFQSAFTNTTKTQNTHQELLELRMKPGFLDDYIFSFEHLRHLAGWGADDAGTVMLFKKGLTQGLHHAVLEKTTLHPTTLRRWMEAMCQQYKLWAQIKASLGGSFSKPQGITPTESQKW